MKVPAVFNKPHFRYAAAGFAVALIAYVGVAVGRPVVHEFNDSFAMKEFKQYGVAGTYRKHFFTFFEKFANMAELEDENEKLRAELAQLEKKETLADADRAERELASMNEVLEQKVHEEAGSKVARLPQTISYEVPQHLMASQLYPLGLAYFRKQEFEKSAVIFDHLFNIPDEHHYETAENFLMSGISWYGLKNYKLARSHIAEANQRSHVSDTVHRQAMLWEAIVEKAEGKDKIAQTKLLHFIGQYPHASEASWINGTRSPARVDGQHEIKDHSVEAHGTPSEEHTALTKEDEKVVQHEAH